MSERIQNELKIWFTGDGTIPIKTIIEETAEHFYNLALEDVKKEIEKNLSVIESKDTAGDSFANGEFYAYNEMLDFIEKQEV